MKKQPKSKCKLGHSLGNKEGKGIPVYREPISWITFLWLSSLSTLSIFQIHFNKKCRRIPRVVDFSIYSAFSSSWTSCSKSCCYSDIKGHWPSQTVLLGTHFKVRAVGTSKSSTTAVSCFCTAWKISDSFIVIYNIIPWNMHWFMIHLWDWKNVNLGIPWL